MSLPLALALVSTPQAQAASLVDAFLTDNHLMGVSVAVADARGRILFHREAGFANAAKGIKMAENTLVRLASVSKPVTSVGVMRLVQGGKLSLDAPVSKWVPEWPKSHEPVTLRQLLSHTAGVRHYRPLGNDPTGDVGKPYPSAAAAVGLFIDDPLINKPGTKYQYSTHAFTIAARAMESATGQTFIAYMREYVFPLAGKGGLDCEVEAENKPNRSEVYDTVDSKPVLSTPREDNSWKHAGGGMEATASGLARLGSQILAGKFLKEASLEQMWSPTKLADGSISKYGLGFGIQDGGFVAHNGAQQGSRTTFLIDRTNKRVAVILTNTSGRHNPDPLAKRLLGFSWKP